jgi:hypothetical protein
MPNDQSSSDRGDSLGTKIEKNITFVLGGIVIGAFLAGVSALLFIQHIVRAEVEDHWKGQIAALSKIAVDEQIKGRFGSHEPALIKKFAVASNECLRINDVQACWGREARTPKWDEKLGTNTLEHTFKFAAPFDVTPIITTNAYAASNKKVWSLYASTRAVNSLLVRFQDITRGAMSEEHVLVSYIAIGNPAKE